MGKLYKSFTHLFMDNHIKFYFLLNIFLAKSFAPLDVYHGIIIIQIPCSASKLTLIILLPSKNHSVPPSLHYFNIVQSLSNTQFSSWSLSPAAKHNQVNPHHFGSLQKELTEPSLN